MKVYAFGNARDHEGSDLVRLFMTRALVVNELRKLTGTQELLGCSSISGFSSPEPLDEALMKFLAGEYNEVGVYDDDDWTPFWIQEMEVTE